MTTEPYRLTAVQVFEAIKTDTLTVENYASSLLDRIQRDSLVKHGLTWIESKSWRGPENLTRFPEGSEGRFMELLSA